VLEALGWGALAASSLVIGAYVAFARKWSDVQVGSVLAFGAGALISAVSFELVEEGAVTGGLGATAIGLGFGAMTYYLADGAIARRHSGGRGKQGRKQSSSSGTALALGAFLDGIPEQMVLGIGLAAGEGISVGLIVAIFVSNLPEAVGSATEMHAAGRSRESVLRLWLAVAVICLIATLIGYGIADVASDELRAGINGFAGGALLVMLIDSMIPDARKQAGRAAGLITVLGFAVAVALATV
jgi:ZIP family zinc transporter